LIKSSVQAALGVLFTVVRGRGILETSPLSDSGKFTYWVFSEARTWIQGSVGILLEEEEADTGD
jgi:hypothetical protein